MTARRTFVDDNRFLFTTDVEDADGFPDFVTVSWTGVAFAPSDDILAPLRTYLRPRHEVSEVWFLYPADLSDRFTQLSRSERFDEADLIPRVYRFLRVEATGEITEEHRVGSEKPRALSAKVLDAVLQDGLRQVFRDTDALATASAGFHFTHPSGSHSEKFIRASQAVSRLHHAYFVAMVILRLISPSEKNFTIWLDTASISNVGHAFHDLLSRGGWAGRRRVETFSGYEGIDRDLRTSPGDLVFISGSTSGSLATAVIERKRLEPAQVITLFYLSAEEPAQDRGLVLCDLSNRDEDPQHSDRDSRLIPHVSYKQGQVCKICELGNGEIELVGDSFFPSTGDLDLRMPTLADRPLDGHSGGRRAITEFDGSDYFLDLVGHGAIRHDVGSLDSSPHGVSTRIVELFGGPLTGKIDAAVDAVLAGLPPVAAIITLTDPDSAALGAHLGTRWGLPEVSVEEDDRPGFPWRLWRAAEFSTLDAIDESRTVLVCAGVVGSGRSLTAIARELRKVSGSFRLRYFVVSAHPESATTWNILVNTLKRVGPSEMADLKPVWNLPREPRLPTDPSPWRRERETLEVVGDWLGEQTAYAHLADALTPRLGELYAMSSDSLFVGAKGAISPMNRNFALWPFDWTTRGAGAAPTHAEIYATVAHLLYESRRRRPREGSANITARRHGYVLHPAIFDRFNDPAIQAAILRAAEPGELDYSSAFDASRAVSDLLWFIFSNTGDETGDAAYEFLLALCEGVAAVGPAGMRLRRGSFQKRLAKLEADEHLGRDFGLLPPQSAHVQALLIYLRAHVDPGALQQKVSVQE